MQALAPETWQMWVAFGAIIAAIVLYSTERLTLELTSLLVIGFFLVFFTLFPVLAADGTNLLSSAQLLAGFANPALVAVLSLLVVGRC